MTAKTSNVALFLIVFAILNLGLSMYLEADLQSVKFFEIRHYPDSSRPIYRALHTSNESSSIYEEVFFKEKMKFQYPPTTLVPFHILFKIKQMNLNTFNLLFSLVTNFFYALSLGSIVFISYRLFVKKTDNKITKILVILSTAMLSISFFPLSRALFIGQIQVWINCILIILVICLMYKKEKIAGILIGLCALIKPTYALILLWGLLRKKKNFVKYFLITTVSATLVSLLVFGIKNSIEYLRVLSFLGKHGESIFTNQSFNGLMHRLLFNGDNTILRLDAFPPFNKYVYIITITASIIFITAALLAGFLKKRKEGSILDFLLFLLTVTLTSPIAWDHHYGFLIIIYLILFYIFIKEKLRYKKIMLILLGISYLLTSHFFAFTLKFANTKYNFIQSHIFVGALILLGLVYYVLFNSKENLVSYLKKAS